MQDQHNTQIIVPGTISHIHEEYATIEVVTQNGCGHCHEPGGCGGKSLAQALCQPMKTYHVPCLPDSYLGEHVQVAINTSSIKHAATLAYLLPLFLLLTGAILGNALFGNIGAISCSLLGLLVAWALLKTNTRSNFSSGKSQFSPYIMHSDTLQPNANDQTTKSTNL